MLLYSGHDAQTDDCKPLKTIREVKPHSFVFAKDKALPDSLCDDIVRRFEDAGDEHYRGLAGEAGAENPALKRSTDLFISGKAHWQDVDKALFNSLAAALREFCGAFPYFSNGFKDVGYGLQRTREGEFYHWHVDGDSRAFGDRQLVAIWYLNDVAGPGGDTEFLFQNVRVKPERGKLILFPPFWTHQHRGVVLERGVKYIATTWIVFQ